mmetsp:Transcript_864/g.2818  ORF Transcript_864/g.2818 Transcript_864/m.2818 type:complete len:209 (+) Transcript_864:296-922(+)
MRRDLRPLRDDRAVHVSDLVPGLAHQPARLGHEHVRRAPLPLRVVIREQLPDVRHPERAGDGVHDAVQQNVAVAVRDAPAVVLELDPTQPQLEAGHLREQLHPMQIEAVPDPHGQRLDLRGVRRREDRVETRRRAAARVRVRRDARGAARRGRGGRGGQARGRDRGGEAHRSHGEDVRGDGRTARDRPIERSPRGEVGGAACGARCAR